MTLTQSVVGQLALLTGWTLVIWMGGAYAHMMISTWKERQWFSFGLALFFLQLVGWLAAGLGILNYKIWT